MSVQAVREYLKQWNRENDIVELKQSSATVELAANAIGTEPARIAKTITFANKERCILIVTTGDKKIDNHKFKQEFGIKANMLREKEVISLTGYEIGGVCPFALDYSKIDVYLDISLREFETIFPAAGSSNSMIELTPEELKLYSHAKKWVDICKGIELENNLKENLEDNTALELKNTVKQEAALKTNPVNEEELIELIEHRNKNTDIIKERRLLQENDAETKRQLDIIIALKEYFAEVKKKIGRPLTACVTTFGCQMNARDSEKIVGILEEIGYSMVEKEDADFVIYNTCTVRENANLRVYGRLGQLKKLKQKNPNMIIALCGCMMQEVSVVDKIKESYRFVDIIFGTHNIFKLAELIKAKLDSQSMIIDIWKDTKEIVEDLPSERKFSFKAGVNIMYGCNNFCSYCIVPYVRGRERSRNPKDIIREIETLVKDGVVEIMLLGQNVNSYGRNLESPMTFSELLQEIEKIEGLERIRFMTSHPKDLSDELIEVMKHSSKICNHLHLPVQAGSSRILKKMNRKYTKEQYLNLVDKIKKAIPNISLTTDIIVGFPGETEEDFLETMEVVEKVRYDSAYTFIYSKRTGTPASSMEEQIPEEVIKHRFDRLLEQIQRISTELAGRDTGLIKKVLVEEKNGQDETLVTGRMTNNLLVHFKGEASLIGKIVNVKLKECKGFYYIGEQV